MDALTNDVGGFPPIKICGFLFLDSKTPVNPVLIKYNPQDCGT